MPTPAGQTTQVGQPGDMTGRDSEELLALARLHLHPVVYAVQREVNASSNMLCARKGDARRITQCGMHHSNKLAEMTRSLMLS